jgi:FAD/FMN-containing dehydrogenase
MTLESALRAAVGSGHVLLEAGLRASYETDWTGRFTGASRAVVRPASAAEVAAVLAACARAGVPVVVQGGNTGLVGGSVPAGQGRNPPVVLVTTRLNRLGDVDVAARQVTAGAGVTLAALVAHVRAAGLEFGVDLAARDSATVGGMVATNAGGIRVLRYGSMRDQVAGAEAVLVDGRIVSRLDGLAKDSTGYDIGRLRAGSEGTLAVLTRLRLRLVPAERHRAVALVAVAGIAEAVALLGSLRDQLPGLCAAELCLADGVALVARHLGVPMPLERAGQAYVLVEVAGQDDPADSLLDALAAAPEVLDATVALAPADRARLWALREGHAEAISTLGTPLKLDVSVPIDRLAEFADGLPGAVAVVDPAALVLMFGHLAEANLHVNVLRPARADRVTETVLSLVASMGGSISSEHGIGRAKAPWLRLARSEVEIDLMRSVKAAFDPLGLLNPGVLWPCTGTLPACQAGPS